MCEMQSLIKLIPLLQERGYCPNTGELQLATTLMFVCPVNEIGELLDKCWSNKLLETVTFEPVDTGRGFVHINTATPVTYDNTYHDAFWGEITTPEVNDEINREIAEILASLPQDAETRGLDTQ